MERGALLLAPLFKLLHGKSLQCMRERTGKFLLKNKRSIEQSAKLAYLDFNKIFYLYRDTIDVQITLVQYCRPLGYSTRKFNKFQKI